MSFRSGVTQFQPSARALCASAQSVAPRASLRIQRHTSMVLYMIGLGLGSERDITLRGLDAVKRCDKVRTHAQTHSLVVSTCVLALT
jgi:hypothetical protein